MEIEDIKTKKFQALLNSPLQKKLQNSVYNTACGLFGLLPTIGIAITGISKMEIEDIKTKKFQDFLAYLFVQMLT